MTDPRERLADRYLRLSLEHGLAERAGAAPDPQELTDAHTDLAAALLLHGHPFPWGKAALALDDQWTVMVVPRDDSDGGDSCATASSPDPDGPSPTARTAAGSAATATSGSPAAIGTATSPGASPPSGPPASLGCVTRKLREGERFLLRGGSGREVTLDPAELPAIRGERRVIRRGGEVVCRVRLCGGRRFSVDAPGWLVSRVCPVAFVERRSA